MPARPRSTSSTKQRDARGSTEDRRRRRTWLLATFSPDLGPNLARCELRLVDTCLDVVDVVTLSVDRLTPGGPYTRDNIQPACTPCQNHQGGTLGAQRRRKATP
jgi:hypothetical protein